ncbi:MAG: GntR family transcriptional regulator, nutrient-sensing system regulator [Pseudonocardiales bacterium]|nr:GntR family transcriptional regulator, nutrient-sensing system regulator [Pseudonocardiales bacterium]
MSSAEGQSLREPKYYTVKRHLLEVTDSLLPGSPVPTERVLAAELGTSRTTVRQALFELVAEGRLVRRQGSGTYVAEPKMTWPLQMASFTEQATANGLTASNQLLSAVRGQAEPDVAGRLGIEAGAAAFRIERLRLADDRPIAVEVSYLSAARFPQLARHLRRGSSLYAVLHEHYGVVPASAQESISTAPATPREAALLDTDTGAPMLVLGRHSFDGTGAPVEWVTSWYRGDRVTLIANLRP